MQHVFIANSGARFFVPIAAILCGAIAASIALSGYVGRTHTPIVRLGLVLIGIGLATNAFSLLFAPSPWWRHEAVTITGLLLMLAGDVVLFRVWKRKQRDAKRASDLALRAEVH